MKWNCRFGVPKKLVFYLVISWDSFLYAQMDTIKVYLEKLRFHEKGIEFIRLLSRDKVINFANGDGIDDKYIEIRTDGSAELPDSCFTFTRDLDPNTQLETKIYGVQPFRPATQKWARHFRIYWNKIDDRLYLLPIEEIEAAHSGRIPTKKEIALSKPNVVNDSVRTQQENRVNDLDSFIVKAPLTPFEKEHYIRERDSLESQLSFQQIQTQSPYEEKRIFERRREDFVLQKLTPRQLKAKAQFTERFCDSLYVNPLTPAIDPRGVSQGDSATFFLLETGKDFSYKANRIYRLSPQLGTIDSVIAIDLDNLPFSISLFVPIRYCIMLQRDEKRSYQNFGLLVIKGAEYFTQEDLTLVKATWDMNKARKPIISIPAESKLQFRPWDIGGN